MTGQDALVDILVGDPAILLDFDGPVCSIFAGYPAPLVAAELLGLLRQVHGMVPESLTDERDPLEVLRWAGVHAPAHVLAVEKALCAAELRAAQTAEPTAFAREVIVAAHEGGMPIAIVSNKSEGAVAAYLARHRLAAYVSVIVGRAFANPAQMKPAPRPILTAAGRLGAKPDSCVLIGDSLADIRGGQAAGVPVIGYANKPHKVSRFADAGANAVVTSTATIAYALLARVAEPDGQ